MKIFTIALIVFLAAVSGSKQIDGADASGKAPTTRPIPFEKEILAFEKHDRAEPPPKDANLFVGSSSIARWKTLADDFPGVPVINRGFGGSRIPDSTRFADRIVLPYRPKRIFLYAGDNDIAGGHSPQRILADFKTFVQTVRAGLKDVPIYFISLKPSPLRAKFLPKALETNALIAAYIKDSDNLHYVDVATPMLGPDGNARAALFGPDRLHMNRAGYEIWIGIIAPLLK
ncbi:MAG TPA: SGNH/GDSL hydrolase family protein [Tepidisphaeraceae bacterium]|jgi:lysophospholipase L1-like esterase|nr:SGNH/GDSL hydrolase family protein [Tepidisphaeraceae bacterium]